MAQKFDLSPLLKAVNPEEAISFFRQKGYRIGFDYRDVWQQEHQAAFTVAKVTQIDLLTEIRGYVDAALADGTTLATFQQALIPKLQARGWWGKQELVDPLDGQAKLVQLGSPRRLEVIYDANLATAYSEGQWERIQRNQQLFPFLEYMRSGSTNPRHTHLAYAGVLLRADDPFWPRHFPIKEWGCKCYVIQRSQRMMDREGLKLGSAPPEVMRTLVNQRTGEIMQVPTGVDPAFNYPPGGRRSHLDKLLDDKQQAFKAGRANPT
ncbi:MAG: phage minor head protein [Polaromonas sp.]